jgi:hypothetical protein
VQINFYTNQSKISEHITTQTHTQTHTQEQCMTLLPLSAPGNELNKTELQWLLLTLIFCLKASGKAKEGTTNPETSIRIRQAMYRHNIQAYHVSIVGVKNKYYMFWVCVCVFVSNISYPAWKGHAPYYTIIFVLSSCTIFFHILENGTTLGKRLWNILKSVIYQYNVCLKHYQF